MIDLSIIIPIYNDEKFLNRCVDSVLSQTFKNFELILIDDGSTDSSPSICDSYLLKDNRVKVIHQKNSGVSVARNNGIKAASGKWITFIDHDDYINENAYEDIFKAVNKTNGRYRTYQFNVFRQNFETGKKYERGNIKEEKEYNFNNNGFDNWIYIWCKIFDRSYLINNNIFFPSDENGYIPSEDIIFCVLLFSYDPLVYGITNKNYIHIVGDSHTLGNKSRNPKSFPREIAYLKKLKIYIQARRPNNAFIFGYINRKIKKLSRQL